MAHGPRQLRLGAPAPQIIPTFFIIMFLVFMMVRLLPGDPA
ncbi:MAG: hypothetical protein R2911_19100 [Caldilineaceae bacterium]